MPKALRRGDTLGGYIIERVAGQGGMGVVYEARDPELNRRVALKVITPDLIGDEAFQQRFEREWRVAAALEHPNIVPVYRAGLERGQMFLAMRFVDGVDLEALIDRDDGLPADEAAAITDQVARALDAAHAAGLVHRDIKPGNVLLVGDAAPRRAFLTDFGLTVRPQRSTRITGPGEFVGTPAFAAPEQIRGGDIDARTDVYALGGLLYHCLTGRVPYAGTDHMAVLHAQLHEPPPQPSKAKPGVPRAFDRVVARAMAKDPAVRYASAGEVGRAAIAAAQGLALPRHRGRPRWLLPATAAAAVGVVAVVAVSTLGGSGPPRKATASAPVFHLAESPDAIAVERSHVWALTELTGGMARLDPRTGQVASYPAGVDAGGGSFPAIAVGGGLVWVAHETATGGVDRIDPATGEGIDHIVLPWVGALATSPGSVWAITRRPREPAARRAPVLVEVDTALDRIVGPRVELSGGPSDVAATGDAVWVTLERRGVVVRVDPGRHAVVKRVRVGRRPAAIAADDEVVWVLDAGDRSLVRVDPAAGESVGAPVSLGKELEDIALARDGLWVAASDGTVTRLDRAGGSRRGAAIIVGRPPLALAADPRVDGAWVASAGDHTVRRLAAR